MKIFTVNIFLILDNSNLWHRSKACERGFGGSVIRILIPLELCGLELFLEFGFVRVLLGLLFGTGWGLNLCAALWRVGAISA